MTYPTGGMSAEEFEAEMFRRFGHRIPKKIAADLDDPLDALSDPAVIREMMADYFRAHIGIGDFRKYHPVLPFVLRERLSLADLRNRSGMTTGDFGAAMQTGIAELLVSKYQLFSGDFPKISRALPVTDFRKVELSTFNSEEPKEQVEDAPLTAIKAKVTEGARKGKLRTFGATISFSRVIWETFGDQLAQGILDYAAVFSGIEMRVIAETVEAASTPTASGSLNAAGLGSAAKAMRDDLNDAGAKCGLGIYSLMVPPALEATARQLRADMGGWPAHIVANQHLTSDSAFYCFADPALSAPLLRLQLRGAGEPKIYVNTRDFMSVQFALQHDFDYLLSPAVPGIVKVS